MPTQNLFKDLIVTQQEILSEAVAKAKNLIGIEETSGSIILRVPKASLGQRDIIALELTGQYFLTQMGKAEIASLSVEDLAKRTGIEANTIHGRCSELLRTDWIRKVGRANYQINQYLLNSILDDISSSRRKSELMTPASGVERLDSTATLERREQDAMPAIEKSGGLSQSIQRLLGSSWGGTPRDWQEILLALKQNALHYSKGSVTGTLTFLTQAGKLRRLKDGRSYKYLLAVREK